ncbi:hypothetical protein J6590_040755 [Homalodisca vitripennis]|nr:hypothetical protein J6590_040755 [Homalodisca vitripennis]
MSAGYVSCCCFRELQGELSSATVSKRNSHADTSLRSVLHVPGNCWDLHKSSSLTDAWPILLRTGVLFPHQRVIPSMLYPSTCVKLCKRPGRFRQGNNMWILFGYKCSPSPTNHKLRNARPVNNSATNIPALSQWHA